MARRKNKKVIDETKSKQKNKKEIAKKKSKKTGNSKNNQRAEEKNKKELKLEKKIAKRRKRKIRLVLILLCLCVAVGLYIYVNRLESSLILKEYFSLLENKKYEEMYNLIETNLSKEDFVNRIKNIQKGDRKSVV